MKYIAFIYPDESGDGFNATIPDLEGCFSCGDTFEQTVEMIKEAGELYCEDLKTIPKASSLKELLANKELDIPSNATPQVVDLKVEKLARINIMIKSDILEAIPQRLAEFNGNRSAYLQNLVIQDLQEHNITI
ncbi:MAG: type II toxin-antitoxin system HicB family antitoxin [Sulfuricurvum sp.]